MDPTANVKPHLPSLSAVTPFRSRPFIPITNDRHGPSYGRAVGGEERATHFPSAQAATSSNSGGCNDQNIPHSSGQRPESSQLIQGSRNGGSGLTMRAVLEPAPSVLGKRERDDSQDGIAQEGRVLCSFPGCNKTLKPSTLNKHLKSHTDHLSCTVCGFETKHRNSLKRHMNRHGN